MKWAMKAGKKGSRRHLLVLRSKAKSRKGGSYKGKKLTSDNQSAKSKDKRHSGQYDEKSENLIRIGGE